MVRLSFRSKLLGVVALVVVGVTVLTVWRNSLSAAESSVNASSAALERTRKQVLMLDDLYKTAVVYITNTYVEDESSVAAGEAAQALFGAMRDKGWHDARLVDATGNPVNDENVPRDKFEKAAIKALLAGKASYEEVVKEQDKEYLRVATVVPALDAKCILCHPKSKEGDVLGAISYKLLVE